MKRAGSPTSGEATSWRLAGEVWAREPDLAGRARPVRPNVFYVELVARIRATAPATGDLLDLTVWARDEVAVGPDLVVISAALDLLPTIGEDPSLREAYLGLVGFGPRQHVAADPAARAAPAAGVSATRGPRCSPSCCSGCRRCG